MAEGTEAAEADPRQATALALARAELADEAPPLGTMPPPTSLKGAAKTLAKAFQGERATVFLDKLGERLAFERTGVRLYDAVLAKMPAARLTEGTLTVEEMRRFRDEELAHMHLVREALEAMGADPTAMTPCADLAGVQSIGLVNALTDPRTTLTQCLGALLTAELADNDGWKMLIAMTEAAGQDELAERFTQALAEEDHHLASVRTWIAERLGVQLGKRLPSTDFGEPVQPA
jgi:tRNA isopentenyl-2-thiomethyl-A-37 hydroxylase MiaE